MELKRLVGGRRIGLIASRWRAEIRIREGPRRGETGTASWAVFSRPGLLPSSLPGREQGGGEEVWEQATHLYGALALRRGLSAGEVVEELQLLREVILRLLLEAPPGNWGTGAFQRDILVLNRILDQGVVRASVAYVDDLFFAHLQGSGIPEGVTPEVEDEIGRQLEALQDRSRHGGLQIGLQ